MERILSDLGTGEEFGLEGGLGFETKIANWLPWKEN